MGGSYFCTLADLGSREPVFSFMQMRQLPVIWAQVLLHQFLAPVLVEHSAQNFQTVALHWGCTGFDASLKEIIAGLVLDAKLMLGSRNIVTL